jgi:hypothetical protein
MASFTKDSSWDTKGIVTLDDTTCATCEVPVERGASTVINITRATCDEEDTEPVLHDVEEVSSDDTVPGERAGSKRVVVLGWRGANS